MQSGRVGSPGTTSGEVPIRAREQRPVSLQPIVPIRPTSDAAKSLSPTVATNAPTMARARRRWRSFRVARWATFVLVLVALSGAVAWGVVRVRAALTTYHAVTADVQGLQGLESSNFSTFTPDDAARVHAQFAQLETDIDLLVRLTRVPNRFERLVIGLPYVGPRYQAGTQTLQVVKLLADSGTSGSAIGEQVLQAYKTNGLSASTAPASPTWLDVVDQRMPQIVQITNQIDEAMALRAHIDERYLPLAAQAKLAKFDEITSRYDLNQFVNTQLPALQSAFGADGPARYLILIQNPSELRPSGGFPGTIALVTFDRGQLQSYEFYDVYDLNQAYTESTHQPIPQPWPLAHYAASPELSILDASWWSDFPTSAATIMSMYQATGWPPIKGVIALDPAMVGSMLRITGPITIDVDGEMRTITADNVHDEIERQRALQRAGEKTQDVHKQVVAIIGKDIIERIKNGDRATMLRMAKAVEQSANHRDLQIYSSDANVQAIIAKRSWSGSLIPDPSIPTLALTYANVAFGKSSELMHPTYAVTIDPPVDGMRLVHLQVTLDHTGSPDDDPFYEGFQRWWIEVTLPAGSERIGSNQATVTNSEEPNGGSYEIPLPSGTRAMLNIDFRMPEPSDLLIRRQAGLTPAQVTVVQPGCNTAQKAATLNTDLLVTLGATCPYVSPK
jgi:hypothetical protein